MEVAELILNIGLIRNPKLWLHLGKETKSTLYDAYDSQNN